MFNLRDVRFILIPMPLEIARYVGGASTKDVHTMVKSSPNGKKIVDLLILSIKRRSMQTMKCNRLWCCIQMKRQKLTEYETNYSLFSLE